MGRMFDRLSSKRIENEKRQGYHADGGGLYLQVSPTQSKSWIFRYMLDGRAREMGLGALGALGLAEARKRAAECRALLLDRIDPIEARNTRRTQEALANAKTISFSDCATRYIAGHRDGWKNRKHAEQWANTLKTYCGPVIGSLPVSKVDTGLVMKVLEPIWTKLPETASRLRARVESVLDWATVRGYRSGENPARWRGHLDKLLPALKKKSRVKHHPALPYDELSAFMSELRAAEGSAARALELLIFSITRTNEVVGAKPEEFDIRKAIWTIPAERMKAKRPHRVPLSKPAVELVREQLKRLSDGAPYLFPGQKEGKPLSNMAMLALMERMDPKDSKYRDPKSGRRAVPHGFRSSFRDWSAETTNYPRELCEMALAHTIGDETEAAYRRGDLFKKRQKLMKDWSQFCIERPAPQRATHTKQSGKKTTS